MTHSPFVLAHLSNAAASTQVDTRVAVIWAVAFVVVTVAITGLSGRVGWSAPIALILVERASRSSRACRIWASTRSWCSTG
jgi:hypothetical protein